MNNFNLSASFANLTFEASNDESLVEYKEMREAVNNYIAHFRKHLQSFEHPLNIILKKFAEIFSSYVDNIIMDIESSRITICESYIQTSERKSKKIVASLQKFILMFQTVLKLFYSKSFSYDCFIEEKDECINLITNFLFNEENIYDSVFRLEKVINMRGQAKFFKKYEDFKNITPEMLEISPKFCLNYLTDNLQQDLLNKKQESTRNKGASLESLQSKVSKGLSETKESKETKQSKEYDKQIKVTYCQ